MVLIHGTWPKLGQSEPSILSPSNCFRGGHWANQHQLQMFVKTTEPRALIVFLLSNPKVARCWTSWWVFLHHKRRDWLWNKSTWRKTEPRVTERQIYENIIWVSGPGISEARCIFILELVHLDFSSLQPKNPDHCVSSGIRTWGGKNSGGYLGKPHMELWHTHWEWTGFGDGKWEYTSHQTTSSWGWLMLVQEIWPK